jgi:uncharacterized protein YprB with RNaseH-like and TPR domain
MVSLLERLSHARVVERLAPATARPIAEGASRTPASEGASRPAEASPLARAVVDADRLLELGSAATLARGFLHVRTAWPLRPPTLARTPLAFAERVHERPRILGGALDRLVLPELEPLAAALASLAGHDDASATRRPVFLDGETTGLDGVPFVLGLAHVEKVEKVEHAESEALIVEQWTLVRLDAERSMLASVFARLSELAVAPLVTFNGASFDVPLLRRRAAALGLAATGLDPAHVDLLHAARRLAADRVDDHRLGTLEREWLVVHRRDDLPSHEIPRVYETWLAKRDDPVALGRLRAVVLHNQADLVTLPALALRLAARLDAPDDLAMATQAAQLLIRHGRLERARALLERALASEPRMGTVWREALACLAELERRAGAHERAAACWRRILAREPDEPEACSALAKLLEHRLGALEEALQVACRSRVPERERIARLERKLGRAEVSREVVHAELPRELVRAEVSHEVVRAELPRAGGERVQTREPERPVSIREQAEPEPGSSPAWQTSVALRFAPWRRDARASEPAAPPRQAAPAPAAARDAGRPVDDDERPRPTYRLFVGR